MDSVLHSFLLVAAAEMGDKTQLLALVLTARFRKPWPILAGILVATILNHALAGWLGTWIASVVSPEFQKWGLAAVFVGFGCWILIPDKDDEDGVSSRFGPFLTTLIAFFLAEMGDKTQLATVALAARFQDLVAVTIGTTLGMLVADGLAVVFGERLTRKIPLKYVRPVAAILFVLTGLAIAFQKTF